MEKVDPEIWVEVQSLKILYGCIFLEFPANLTECYWFSCIHRVTSGQLYVMLKNKKIVKRGQAMSDKCPAIRQEKWGVSKRIVWLSDYIWVGHNLNNRIAVHW